MELIATREYFPSRLFAAARQRSRWMLGIVFQGWTSLGWGKTLRIHYTLFRDRKGLFCGLLNIASYSYFAGLLGMTILALWAGRRWDAYWPEISRAGSLWTGVLGVNLLLQAHRILQRMYCTSKVSSGGQVLMSPVRMLWASVVDICSTAHAIHRFSKSVITGKPLQWAKTAHEYPTEELIRSRHRRLGELLMERRLVSPVQLIEALDVQKTRPVMLGQILVNMGAISRPQLENSLAEQSVMEFAGHAQAEVVH